MYYNKLKTIFLISVLPLFSACTSTFYTTKDTGNVNVAYLSTNDESSFLKNPISDNIIFDNPYSNLLTDETINAFLDIKSLDKSKKPSNISVRWTSEKAIQNTHTQSFTQEEELNSEHPWDLAHQLFIDKIQDGQPVLTVEPDFSYSFDDKSQETISDNDKSDSPLIGETLIVEQPSIYWPTGDKINWHQSDEFSGLTSAQNSVFGNTDKSPISIAHLDTGYTRDDELKPEHFSEEGSKDCVNNAHCAGESKGKSDDVAGHGVRTLSSLAGSKINVSTDTYQYQGYLGNNPYAKVVEYRIHESKPVHFNSKDMGAAIKKASENGADVISLSAGGFPSLIQKDAVNFAYENGTAIIAATGNHFKIPYIVSTPNMVGFPARYNRVLAVTGATYNKNTYGESDCNLQCFFEGIISDPFNVGSYFLRGNTGYKFQLKGKSISGYTPNVPYSSPSKTNYNQVGLNGAGTSHATTQVAAAASIWLHKNRSDIVLNNKWNSWEKSEAVYQALMKSADKSKKNIGQFGEGLLKANKALSYSYTSLINEGSVNKRRESSIDHYWLAEFILAFELPLQLTSLNKALADGAKESLEKMLTQELIQVINSEFELYEQFTEYQICKINTQSTCKELKNELIKEIRDKDISKTLKNAL